MSICALIMVSLSACASNNIVKVSEAAPITYKMEQGVTKYASLEMPSAPNTFQHRRPLSLQDAPSPYAPQTTAPRGPKFNPGAVDEDLYSHQKLGQPYKMAGSTYVPKHEPKYDKSGLASWYGPKYHGRPTASGEIFNKNDITAAHKTLPMNSMVHVENLSNGRTLTVRINDRGPFVTGRIIDLSEASAKILGYTQDGTARVRVRYMGPADPNAAQQSAQSLPPLFEAPSLTVEAPNPKDMPFTNPEDSAPKEYQERDYFEIDRSPNAQDYSAPVAPSAPQPAPEAGLPESDGQITLTIKGPIRMAKSENSQAKFIPAVHYSEKKDKN